MVVAGAVVLGGCTGETPTSDPPSSVAPGPQPVTGSVLVGTDGHTALVTGVLCRSTLTIRDDGARTVLSVYRQAGRVPGSCPELSLRGRSGTSLWGRSLVDGTDGHAIPSFDARRLVRLDTDMIQPKLRFRYGTGSYCGNGSDTGFGRGCWRLVYDLVGGVGHLHIDLSPPRVLHSAGQPVTVHGHPARLEEQTEAGGASGISWVEWGSTVTLYADPALTGGRWPDVIRLAEAVRPA